MNKPSFPAVKVTVDACILRNESNSSGSALGSAPESPTRDTLPSSHQTLQVGYILGTHGEDGKNLPVIVMSGESNKSDETVEVWICGAVRLQHSDTKDTMLMLGLSVDLAVTDHASLELTPGTNHWDDIITMLKTRSDDWNPALHNEFTACTWLDVEAAQQTLHESMARLTGK